jgi:hypothetical protein
MSLLYLTFSSVFTFFKDSMIHRYMSYLDSLQTSNKIILCGHVILSVILFKVQRILFSKRLDLHNYVIRQKYEKDVLDHYIEQTKQDDHTEQDDKPDIDPIKAMKLYLSDIDPNVRLFG